MRCGLGCTRAQLCRISPIAGDASTKGARHPEPWVPAPGSAAVSAAKSRRNSGAPVSSLRIGSTIGGLDAVRARLPASPLRGFHKRPPLPRAPDPLSVRIFHPGLLCHALSALVCRLPATQAPKVRSRAAQAEGCAASGGLGFPRIPFKPCKGAAAGIALSGLIGPPSGNPGLPPWATLPRASSARVPIASDASTKGAKQSSPG